MVETNVVSFYRSVLDRYRKGIVPLETLVRLEMIRKGYDPNNLDDIETYWQTVLIDDDTPPDDIPPNDNNAA
jgi:hypothetical protein